MNTYAAEGEAVTVDDSQNIATWNRQRTLQELRNFINGRHALLPDNIDIE